MPGKTSKTISFDYTISTSDPNEMSTCHIWAEDVPQKKVCRTISEETDENAIKYKEEVEDLKVLRFATLFEMVSGKVEWEYEVRVSAE